IPPDGKGLNPLLQNFWMVIHPPVLFLGFAFTAIPFSFAVAGLWKKNYSQWIVNALPWTIAAAVLLGLGIMLGAYWAYGILGWGGYWGWDPVENSSLIPWLLLMALLHTMLIQLRTQKLPRTNFGLAIMSFVLVVYSTFLTRSGVLGDSSVHSFTDPGSIVYGLLIAFVVLFTVLGFGFLLLRNKELSNAGKPMNYLSREFVLFAGSFLLLLVAAVVFFGTNVPLVSKVRVEPSFYDNTTLPFAAVMTLFIGLSLMIRWGTDEYKIVAEKSLKAFLFGALLTAVVAVAFGITGIPAIILIFASSFTVAVNLEVAFMTMQGNWRMMGGKVAHIGLGLFFLGVIFNGLLKEKKTFSLPQNTTVDVFDHRATFTGYRSVEGQKTAFDIKVEKGGESFVLSPLMFETESSGLMRTPDLHSYLTRDFYVSPVSMEENSSHQTTIGETVALVKGKSGALAGATVRFVQFEMDTHTMASPTGSTVGTVLEITKGKDTEKVVPAISYDASGVPKYTVAASKLLGSNLQLLDMHIGTAGDESQITIGLAAEAGTKRASDTLIIEASVHPYVGLLWIGSVLMFLGMIIAYARRKNEETLLAV
ncbi:MAG: cytochrome c biogenesis protein CcsA, partial [Opitutaceae bacterium]